MLLERIKKLADKFGMWYFIKSYNEKEMYDFLCLFFLNDMTFDVSKYTLEEALDHLDNSLGDYNELLTYEDKVEIYSIAKEIKSSS